MARQAVVRITAAAVLLISTSLAVVATAPSAAAQADPNAPPPSPAEIAVIADGFLSELLAVDLDGDGVADFDANGDGVPEIPVGEPGDLDLRPGDGVFGEAISAQLAASIGVDPTISIGDDSRLLFNCSGMALSFDSDGNMVDWAIGMGSSEGGGPTGQVFDLFPAGDYGMRAFTRSNPFIVQDRVVYFGRLPTNGDGPRNHTWSTQTGGISIDSGGDDNPNGNNRNAGEVDIGEDTPAGGFLIPTGTFPFEGELMSQNSLRCEGEGWVKFETGNPVLSAAGVAASVATLAGAFGLLFNARPAVTWKA